MSHLPQYLFRKMLDRGQFNSKAGGRDRGEEYPVGGQMELSRGIEG